MDQAMM